MNQKIHNFNQDLVKTINQSIFKEEMTSIQELKERAFQKGYEEKDVPEILNLLFHDGIIELPLQKIGEHDFLVNEHKINELERENLI
ncbi:hypothetical protein ABLV92_05085 [Staphylococcus equorum]